MRNLDYKINIKATNRTSSVGFKIEDDGVVVLVPKFLRQKQIDKIIQEKHSWIIKKLALREKNKISKNQILFLGKIYDINFVETKKPQGLILENSKLYLKSNDFSPEKKDFFLKSWLKNEASNYLIKRTNQLSKTTNLIPTKIILKFLKSRWGSCNYKGEIVLNINLMQHKKETIDYVIIHELCHLKHMNHSKKFWSLVETHFPNYKLEIKNLKSYA